MSNEENNDKKFHFDLEKIKSLAVPVAKIVLPIAALVIVIATIITLVQSKRVKESETAAAFTEATTESTVSVDVLSEPLEENAYPAVNEFAASFYQALADGDMDTVLALRDYTSDKERLTYEKKSEYIESYNNITCYTKDALEEGSYYLYVYYEVKFNDIDTTVPGLNTFYVYTNDEGQLQIDGNMEESITAALKLVTNQDDVKDLFNKVNVSYKEAVAEDEALNTLLTELPTEIKTSVGVALAQLEQETEASTEAAETEQASETEQETTETATETLENQAVNQQVRATDTVNVRSSDSSEADKLGKAQEGDILTRTEIRVNGWSKVEYEGKEAFIKSEYLEVVSDDTVTDTQSDTTDKTTTDTTETRTVTATTNVNVRNAASTDADKIGKAEGGNTYTVIEDLGEWLKIDYNGQDGYVKAEYFE